jgi:poly(3-hydroxybutyrate) depolymerase
MTPTRLSGLLLSVVTALVVCSCEPADSSDTACAGYLGCSAGKRIGPPEGTVTVTAATLVQPLGVTPTGINAVLPGAGCGKPIPETAPVTKPGTPKGYMHYTVQGTGATLAGTIPAKVGPRTFWVRVPADYDPEHAYRVVYIGQGCGGFDSANTNTLSLYKEGLNGNEEAIYVALDIPRDMANMDCYDNRDGKASQEWEAFELFHKVVDENYCVDNNRIYVSGYSTGGWLANMWGCYFSGDGEHPAADPNTPRAFAPKYHIRGQAAVTGGEPTEQPACGGPVAAIWIHDNNDTANPIAGNIQALKRVGRMNGCDTNYETANTRPWHPEFKLLGEVCRKFTSCPENYPVVFCTTTGLGHSDQPERAIPAFNAFFNELEPNATPTP